MTTTTGLRRHDSQCEQLQGMSVMAGQSQRDLDVFCVTALALDSNAWVFCEAKQFLWIWRRGIGAISEEEDDLPAQISACRLNQR